MIPDRRPRRAVAILVSGLLPLAALGSPAAGATGDMLERYRRAATIMHAGADRWALNNSVAVHWIEGGDRFWYERETAKGHRYVVFDPAVRQRHDAFDHVALARLLADRLNRAVDPDDLSLSNLVVSSNGLSFGAYGKTWRLNTAGALSEEASDPRLLNISPDGARAVFWRDGQLWVRTVASGVERQLTTDGAAHDRYGVLPANQPIQPRAPLVIWSPDGTRILTAQTDDRHVSEMPLLNFVPKGDNHPVVVPNRYSEPGDPVVTTFRPVIIDVTNGRMTPVKSQPTLVARMSDSPMSGNRMWWSADGRTAYYVDIERGEKAVHVNAVDAATGAVRPLFDERSDTYIELGADVYAPVMLHPLPKRHELLWYSERSGWPHLYLYDLDTGRLKRPLDTGPWVMRNLLSVDETRGTAFVSVIGRDPKRNPYDQEIAAIDLKTGRLTILSGGDGDHRVADERNARWWASIYGGTTASPIGAQGVSPSGDYFVETVTHADSASTSLLRDRQGRLVATIEAADMSRLPTWWRWPHRFAMTAADGHTFINSLVFRPSDYDATRRYPVIDLVYGGPQVALVPTGFGQQFYFDAAALAELGFVVTIIDGRGTPFRGRDFHTQSYRHMETVSNLADHIAGIRQLARQDSAVDASRVGLTGLSGGGYLTAIGMTRFADFYRVGVAVSGNYDYRLQGSTWGERYEGYPVGAYWDAHSVLTYAGDLKGKLLIEFGMMDQGVHPTAPFHFEQALIDHNKDFDILPLPEAEHNWTSYVKRRLWDYFVTNLAGENPPRDFLLKDEE